VTVPSSIIPPDLGFSDSVPERIPWSELGPDFIQDWGRADPAHPQAEHLEILGPTGCGKTYSIATIMQQRGLARKTSGIIVATKKDDDTLPLLGWPIVDRWDQLQQERWSIFWPKTKYLGSKRKAYHDEKIRDLLSRLWVPNANVMINFDEIGYLESLSTEMRELIQMFWREGRANAITVLAGKQRPQGVARDMHSETYWTAAYRPNDESDMERFAELFGPRRFWLPVFRTLSQDRREFLLRYSKTNTTYITWMDNELRPVKMAREGAGSRIWTRGRTSE
jgi:nucleoside-triphosphatase THEP1